MNARHLTDEPISAAALASELLRNSDGAVVTFEGTVRDHHEGRAVESIFYEAYRAMAEKEIAKIVAQVEHDFPGVALAMVHRLGHVAVGEVSIAIAAVASHRNEAFLACRAAIDRVKETVPIWKKERSPDGEIWQGWQGGAQSS